MNSSVDKIKSVEVKADRLKVGLEDGRELSLPLSLFPTLAEATIRQRAKWEPCGAGTGIHWPAAKLPVAFFRRENGAVAASQNR